jgi:hypothetical protein
MSTKSEKVKMPSHQNAFRPPIAKVIFPRIYDNQDLRIDKKLKPIKIISNKGKAFSSNGNTKISFELLSPNSTADVFLYINGNKSDMYYSVPSGKYSFNLYLETGKNIIEVYYVVNGYKSPSVFNTRIRK